jgi:uncharacterized protein (DUF1697 family)
MPVLISLLRGINVVGRHVIRMEPLRQLYQSLGLEAPQTIGLSGNVVFKSQRRDMSLLAKRIALAIGREFGFTCEVILRTPSEIRGVIARNPFAARDGIAPSKFAVMFLARDPGREARERLLAINPGPEEIYPESRELYIYFPNGMGRPKMSPSAIEKALDVPGTYRNWNTVSKLCEIAERMESEVRPPAGTTAVRVSPPARRA